MQIFITYAKEDEAFVSQLAQDLKSQGAKIWVDMQDASFDDQETWEASIQGALDKSDVLLVVLSCAALQHEYIEQDWKRFIAEGRPVLIAMNEHCDDIPPALHTRQPIDFSRNYKDGLNRLQLMLIETTTRLSSSKWHRHDDE